MGRAYWLKIRSSRTFATTTVTIAIFVDLFLYGLIIPIIPQILENQVHVPPSDVQLHLAGLLSAYRAALLVFSPISGYFADRWTNRKLPFIGGLVMLAGATTLFMLGESVALLYVARVLQGISAAIVWAVGLALLVDAVGTKDIGAAIGWTSIGLALGNTMGPLIGGIVYRHAGRYATFGVAFCLIAVDAIMRLLLVEPAKGHAAPELNTISSSEIVPEKVVDLEIKPCDVSDQGSVAISTKPTAIVQLLKHADMSIGLLAVFFTTVVLTGLEAIIPLHVETVFHWTSQGAGLVLLGIVAPIFFSPIIGIIYDRHGANVLVLSGFVLMTTAAPLLALVRFHNQGNVILLVCLLALVGLGISLVMAPQMAEIATFAERKAVDEPDLFGSRGATAQCCALMTVFTAAAGVVGPLVAGAVQNAAGWMACACTVGAFAAAGMAAQLIRLVVVNHSKKHCGRNHTMSSNQIYNGE